MFYLCLLLLISSVDIDYPKSPAAWPLGSSVTPWRGYGQWNSWDEFHRALDFHGSVGDLVFAPYSGDTCWVIGISDPTDDTIPVEGSVLIGTGKYSVYGWHYAHIDINPENYVFRVQRPLGRDIVSALVQVPDLGPHVHFSWLDVGAYAPGGPHPQYGYFNPFRFLGQHGEFPYDEAVFGPVDYNGYYGLNGVLFVGDDQPPVPVPEPQDIVRGIIDILVRAYTKYYYDLSNDKCGVREVRWRLLWQDPSTLEYQPNGILLGSWRTLFNFSGYIPDDNNQGQYYPEYHKIYWENTVDWRNELYLTNTCDTKRESASFPGVETVWINPYNCTTDYIEDEFCRGAWDTRLCTSDSGNPANTDKSAAFFDGRYAIEVEAIPQRSDCSTLVTLPVLDITDPESEVTGVIVDNWAPRIIEIYLIENDWQTIRWGEYEENEPNNQNTGRTLSYIHPYGTEPYITTGSGINEYTLRISYSEPVTSLKTNILVTIKMVTGPDSTVNWIRVMDFELDPSCYNAIGECMVAEYYASGDQPPDYIGNQIVEMTITREFATDQAERGLDADATTIAPAWGTGGTDNYETTYDFVEDWNPFTGYYREDSNELDSRSRVIYAYYDRIYTPTDNPGSLEWIRTEFTLTGALYDAELFNEVNLGGSGSNSCNIYGGTWMCDIDDEDVLHLYIVDYQGTIMHDEMFFDPGTSDAYAEICRSAVTTPVYEPENPYEPSEYERDRYGWLGWRELTPGEFESNNREDAEEIYLPQGNRNVPEDIEFNNKEDVYKSDVELYYIVCDAYTGQDVTESLLVGQEWFNTVAYRWYSTTISGMSGVGNDGAVSITTRTYNYPSTTPEYNTETYLPPGTAVYDFITINQDNTCRTESSREVEIEDYFAVFPNPARGSVNIEFMTSEAVGSTVRIYDISGHLVNTIAEELPGMQNHNLLWDLKDASGHKVPVGIYYVSIASGSSEEIRTVIVIH